MKKLIALMSLAAFLGMSLPVLADEPAAGTEPAAAAPAKKEHKHSMKHKHGKHMKKAAAKTDETAPAK